MRGGENMISKNMVVTIPKPNLQLLSVNIKGTAPLIFHRWSEKAKKMIQDKQAKKANKGREARNPEKEYEESFYYNSEGKIAFPALNIKQAITDSSRNVEGITMTLLRGALLVQGDEDGLIPVKYKEKSMREDMVRLGGMGNPADIRYRGQVTGWSMKFTIQYNGDVLSAEQIVNLLSLAGFACGLGEWRPERNGAFGTFEVV